MSECAVIERKVGDEGRQNDWLKHNPDQRKTRKEEHRPSQHGAIVRSQSSEEAASCL